MSTFFSKPHSTSRTRSAFLKYNLCFNYLIYLATLLLVFFIGYRTGQTSSFSQLSFPSPKFLQQQQLRTYPIPELSEDDYKKVFMAREEIDTILKYLPRKGVYVEWGAGGSTLLYPRFVGKAISIEHVQPWCEKVERELKMEQEKTGNLKNVNFYCVPIKRVDGSDRYFINENEGDYRTFKRYVDYLEKVGVKKVDFALIDGRARVAVALRVLPFLKEGSVVAVHDTEHRPEEYKEIFEHYDLVDKAVGKDERGISILKRKMKYKGGRGLPVSEEYINELYNHLPH